jgi:hypothetical protein
VLAETAEFAWKIWFVDSIALSAGEHSVTSRAIDSRRLT